MYNSNKFIHESDIEISDKTKLLLDQASKIYEQNFDGNIWYGRCIFFSWYCSKGTCTFCYRSTLKHKIRHDKHMRSMGSMLVEALFCKVFNWRIEFLTGGYQEDWVFSDIVTIAKNISLVLGEKIWVNIGALDKNQIEQLSPYLEGVCGSIESPVPRIHEKVCPDKPIQPYEEMFQNAENLRRSACFIYGLGDTDEDFQTWINFITKNKLDRITVYALKPVRGGAFTESPSVDSYVRWIAKLRIALPQLEIIGGTNLRRSEEVGLLVQAGVNAITKFPATKQFATKKAHKIRQLVNNYRIFISNITQLPAINWDEKIDELQITEELKKEMKEVLPHYLQTFSNPKDLDLDFCDE